MAAIARLRKEFEVEKIVMAAIGELGLGFEGLGKLND